MCACHHEGPGPQSGGQGRALLPRRGQGRRRVGAEVGRGVSSEHLSDKHNNDKESDTNLGLHLLAAPLGRGGLCPCLHALC